MSRTQSNWEEKQGSYLTPPWAEGRDILIRGSSKYLCFGTTVGESGYGIRDNAGTLQFKHSGGSWADIGSGGGGAISIQTVSGTIDGANTAFTMPSAITGKSIIILNQTILIEDVDYTVSTTNITYTTAPPAGLSGKSHKIICNV